MLKKMFILKPQQKKKLSIRKCYKYSNWLHAKEAVLVLGVVFGVIFLTVLKF